MSSEGAIQGLTETGVEMIQVCQLDRARLVEFRRGIFQLLQMIQSSDDPKRRELRARFFGFPANLPRLRSLRSLRPLQGNSRPTGMALSWHEVASRGQLPDTY